MSFATFNYALQVRRSGEFEVKFTRFNNRLQRLQRDMPDLEVVNVVEFPKAMTKLDGLLWLQENFPNDLTDVNDYFIRKVRYYTKKMTKEVDKAKVAKTAKSAKSAKSQATDDFHLATM